MGVSILSGCLTTFGCGLCLFFGNFTFFQTFALVVTCTIFMSFVVAMFTFGALMHIWGPEKDFGMLFKATKEPTKEEAEEIEYRLIQMQEHSSEISQKIDFKIKDIEDSENQKLEVLSMNMHNLR